MIYTVVTSTEQAAGSWKKTWFYQECGVIRTECFRNVHLHWDLIIVLSSKERLDRDSFSKFQEL